MLGDATPLDATPGDMTSGDATPQPVAIAAALRLYSEAAWCSLERFAARTLAAIPEPHTSAAALLLQAMAASPLQAYPAGDLDALAAHSPEAACWLASARTHLTLAQQRSLGKNPAGARQDANQAIHSLLAASTSLGLEITAAEREQILRRSEGLADVLLSQIELQIALQVSPLPRRIIFVLGMHRSGTSALTGMLVKAGLEAPLDLMPASEANPRGYWESVGLMQSNDALLEALGSHWSSVDPLPLDWISSEPARQWRSDLLRSLSVLFPHGQHPIIKDPRFCILMPGLQAWLQTGLLHFSYLLPVRHPWEVACSLQQSEQTPIVQGLRLWLSHTLMAEYASRAGQRLVVDFRQLIQGPAAVLEQCRALVAGDNQEPDAAWTWRSDAAEAASFIDPHLQRQRFEARDHWRGDPAAQDSVWATLADKVYAVLSDPNLPATELASRLEPYRQQWLAISI